MYSSITARIKTHYHSFGASSQKLADFILKNGVNCSSLTIKEFAEKAGVSTATLSRFANQLGYQNFSQFRWDLSNNGPTTKLQKVRQVSADDTPKMVSQKLLSSNIETLNETFALMTNEQLTQASRLLTQAKQISFFGLGSSNIVAEDCYHMFLRIPKIVTYASDYHINIMQASRMTKQSLAVLISHTGNDNDILYIAEILKHNQVPMITITSFANSSLDDYGTVRFHSISADQKYRTEALLSVTSQIAIGDTLYMLASQKLEKASNELIQKMDDNISGRHQGTSK